MDGSIPQGKLARFMSCDPALMEAPMLRCAMCVGVWVCIGHRCPEMFGASQPAKGQLASLSCCACPYMTFV